MNYASRQVEGGRRLALPDWADGGNPRRKWIVLGAGALVLLVLAWLIFGGHKEPVTTTEGQVPSVTVIVPGRQTVTRTISATGSLAARREMPVGVAGEGGMVTRVLVEPGQWVGAGQVLALVDRSVQTQTAASLAAQVNVARSDAALASSNYARAQALVGNGFISKADLEQKAATRDAAAARVRVAEAQLAETRARNGRLDIRAPAAGLVLTRAIEPGQIISSASGTLFRMAKGGEMELRAQLSEADMAGLSVGVPAKVTPVGSTQAFNGQVWQVSPIIDPTTRQGIARVALAYDPALRPGGFAAVTLASGSKQAPVLPQSAILSDAKGNYVYIIDAGNHAVRRDVTLGEVSDAGVAIAAGLAGNEDVVLSAGAFLSPGQKVLPQRRKA